MKPFICHPKVKLYSKSSSLKISARSFSQTQNLLNQKRNGQTNESDQPNGKTLFKHKKPTIIDKKGIDIMNSPLLNKGVAFTHSERDRLKLRGLLPPCYSEIEDQVVRIKKRLDDTKTDIGKYLMLNSLQDRNETLFYRVVIENIKELAPIIYTPTVGKVCQGFGFLYRRPRGMYFSTQDRGEMATMVYNWDTPEVDVVVMTDGSRVLGLGDLGANGMAIPIGKLALYVAAGGIDPARVLPVMIDAGTNNDTLLHDPFYLGLKHKRITGEAYASLIDEVIFALRNRWPNVLIQFEDFSNENAYPLLHKYRHKVLCFNDDIQGTGSVALGGIYSALRAQGLEPSAIKDQRIVCLGAGSAGLGVCFSLHNGMKAHGMSAQDAAKNFWLVDHMGFLHQDRSGLSTGQKVFARNDLPPGSSLVDVIKKVKPTILLGLSGVGGLFTEDAIREVAKHVKQPIIFPLSNPTDRAECSFEHAVEWTDGRVLFASGSPFEPVTYKGKQYIPSQGNNMFIYPGVGLGAVVSGAKRISTTMFSKAAETLSQLVPQEHIDAGRVYPDVSNIRHVSHKIAVEVVKLAFEQGLATKTIPDGLSIEQWVKDSMYEPEYSPYVVTN